MKYHNITTDDMRNGEGLRTVLWLSGCNHHCKGCHNPMTWDPKDGLDVTDDVLNEILTLSDKPYISGITISGGDPLFPTSRADLAEFLNKLKYGERHIRQDQTIWLYTGFQWETLYDAYNSPHIKLNDSICDILRHIDVLIDGKYIEELSDQRYPWAGSTNQRVIDVQKSLTEGEVVLYVSH